MLIYESPSHRPKIPCRWDAMILLEPHQGILGERAEEAGLVAWRTGTSSNNSVTVVIQIHLERLDVVAHVAFVQVSAEDGGYRPVTVDRNA